MVHEPCVRYISPTRAFKEFWYESNAGAILKESFFYGHVYGIDPVVSD